METAKASGLRELIENVIREGFVDDENDRKSNVLIADGHVACLFHLRYCRSTLIGFV